MAPSRWETYRLYGWAAYVLGITVPLKTLQWIVRGPRPHSWSLRTTLYVHMMKMFASKEGLGWQPALPPVPPLEDAQDPAPVSFVDHDAPSPPLPAIGDDAQKARESAPKIDDKNYMTTGVTIPLEPHKSILGPPIYPYTHTYAHPKTGERTMTTVEPKAVRGYWIEWADGIQGDRKTGKGKVIFAMHGGGYVGGWPTFPNFYRLSRRGGFPVFCPFPGSLMLQSRS